MQTRQLSIRLAGTTYAALYALVPSGEHSSFIDRATQAALSKLAGTRAEIARTAQTAGGD
jgi:hypothetical protein